MDVVIMGTAIAQATVTGSRLTVGIDTIPARHIGGRAGASLSARSGSARKIIASSFAP